MAADLNQALQRTISANAEVTQMLDSLSSMADQPMLTFGARHNGFADFLHISALRDTAGITYTIKNSSEEETGRRNSAQGRICSDTLLLAQMPHSAIEVKAFANPSLLSILKYSNQQWSVISLACGILLLGLLFVKQRSAMPNSSPSVLVVQCQEQTLTLTPMQEKLISKHYHRFQKGIFIGVGGSFDVLSGSKKRAASQTPKKLNSTEKILPVPGRKGCSSLCSKR